MMLLLFCIGQNFQDSGNGQDRNQPKIFEPTIYHKNGRVTGKSLSEVLIYLSINPQYDNRLFNELRVQYKKITRAEHVKNMLFTQIV